MKELLNQSQLDKLKSELPDKWYITIADNSGVTPNYVVKVFNNQAKKIDLIEKVIDEAIKLRSNNLARIAKINEKIASKIA